MLINIEGGDASGKDTVAAAVAKMIDAEVINFPNDDAMTGPMIRGYLAKKWSVKVPHDEETKAAVERGMRIDVEKMGALAFQALQVTNRMELMSRLKKHKGDIVLVRYWQSGWVYGQLDGLDPDWLASIHETMVQPDLNILLDVDAETAIKRLAARGDNPERYEGNREFTNKVCELYRSLWEKKSDGWKTEEDDDLRWSIIDAKQDVVSVVADVMRLVHGYIVTTTPHY